MPRTVDPAAATIIVEFSSLLLVCGPTVVPVAIGSSAEHKTSISRSAWGCCISSSVRCCWVISSANGYGSSAVQVNVISCSARDCSVSSGASVYGSPTVLVTVRSSVVLLAVGFPLLPQEFNSKAVPVALGVQQCHCL